MPLLHIFILSLIQGLTEFLPISSSGHLIIIPRLFHWQDQGLAMDVAVHLGTLLSVLVYFRRDVVAMVMGFFALIFQKRPSMGGTLSLHICLATLPAVAVGGLLGLMDVPLFRTLLFVGWTTLIFGGLLYWVDKTSPRIRGLQDMTYGKAFLVGVAQSLALMPGTSRSGICMTACRYLGMKAPDAARFSFLLSIPTIAGAGVHTGVKLYLKNQPFFTPETLWAMAFSAFFGLLAIHFMMTWLKKNGFGPFVLYRVFLGLFLLAMGYGIIGS